MYFHKRLFLHALSLALFKPPFRFRRWFFVLFFTGLFGFMWGLVAVGRALDHVFFPGFKEQRVEKPVFIIAPPRSGTTYTQKLMSLDSERFVFSRLYQTIFPCIVYQKLFMGLAKLDALCGGLLNRLVHLAEKTWFGSWDDLHMLRFDEPEEDDGFFVYTFVTEAIFLLFPFVDELWEAGFADDLPQNERKKLMDYYRSCLQRQLYLHGPERTVLSKATQFSGAICCILEAFPDARIVTIARHPYQSIASHVSLFYPAWQVHSPEIAMDSKESMAYGKLALKWFEHLYRSASKIPAEQYYRIDFRDLVRQPAETVEQVYEHFGFEMSAEFREALRVAGERGKNHESKHHYTLEQFGLSPAWVQAELGEMLDAYGLER